jgi:hypothetical protein
MRLCFKIVLFLSTSFFAIPSYGANAEVSHNVILFVPDGLRSLMVNEESAPAMSSLRDKGVNFKNPHSLFPTFTMPNASAMATGHYLGDTGDFGNTLFAGFPLQGDGGSVTPFLEDDGILGEMNTHFSGNYLDEITLLQKASEAGYSTAAVGKLGPVLVFEPTDRTGEPTIIIDDSTGSPKGIPLSSEMTERLNRSSLPLTSPSRGENGDPGNALTPGTKSANVDQQKYYLNVVNQVILPLFKERKKPFVLVFWSRDPDGTQHNQGDSLNQLIPGINGPTSLTAIHNADDDLTAIRGALDTLVLAETTNIIVTADHGFSTISKKSKKSRAAKKSYPDVPSGFLPPGFLAIDLSLGLNLPLFDPDNQNLKIEPGSHSKKGNGLIGKEPVQPEVVVAANGGSDLIYLPKIEKKLARKVVDILLAEDYVSGIFVSHQLGRIPGTLSLGAINLEGSAITPVPSIVVNFRSFSTGCKEPLTCTVEIADTLLQQGQGIHGNFSRGDTMNFMAAFGPDFKNRFVDPAPVSTADIGMTVAKILGLNIPFNGKLFGRVIDEAFLDGKIPKVILKTESSPPARNGLRTFLKVQLIGSTRYFDAAGFPGRTVGLP